MTTHLYCVLPHEVRASVPPGLSGLEGAAVRALPVDGVVAWVSDFEPVVRSGLSVADVRAHDAVVEAALETGSTPAPVRFGQRFDDDDACRAAIASRAASVESLLADLQGHVEMTLLVTPSTRRMIADLEPVVPEMFDPAARGSGRAYLDALRKREMATGTVRTAIDALARRLMEAVSSIARRVAIHDTVTPMPLRTISHLVSRRDVNAYKDALAELTSDGQSRVIVIGPRAPYSFSALSAGGSAHGMKLAD